MLHQGEKEKHYKEEVPRCTYCFGPARGHICNHCMEELCRYMDCLTTGGNHRTNNYHYKHQARSFPAKRHIILSRFIRLATRFNSEHDVTVHKPLVKKTPPHRRHKKSELTPIKLVLERILLKLQLN